MISQETFNKIADGMEEVNREMANKIEQAAPMCHFQRMNLECGADYGLHGEWWECSICGHQKEIF